LVAELKAAFPDVETTLIPSGGGVFEVEVDGTTVFSKKALGRHAESGEVVDSIKAGP
jgi:selenoprotein W-related protein